MKKLMLAALLTLGASAAFAGDSEPLKAILKAKEYTEAETLLNQNLSQLASPAEKAKAYNHLVEIALKKYDKEMFTQQENATQQFLLKDKAKLQPYDTLGFYMAAYRATANAVECFRYDAEPDEKGKVKPKYTESLAPKIANARVQLVNLGSEPAQRDDAETALKYWGLFLDTEDIPALAQFKTDESGFLGQVALYAGNFAMNLKQYDRAKKYLQIAMQSPGEKKQAEELFNALEARSLKTRADSLAYVEKMKAAYQADPTSSNNFSNLVVMLNALNMTDEADKLIEDQLAKNPNSAMAWAMKGQALYNKNSKAENPNWDEVIDCFKKAVAIDDTNPAVLNFLGASIYLKGATSQDATGIKQLCAEAARYLERAREIDPDQAQSRWSYPLYQTYYQLYGPDDPKTKEVEALLNK